MRSLQRCDRPLSRLNASILCSVLIFTSCAGPVPVRGEESDTFELSARRQLPVDPVAATDSWYEGDHSSAVEIYRQLVSGDPTNEDYRLSLIVLLREMGRNEEALSYSAGLTGVNTVEHEMNLALAEDEALTAEDAALDADLHGNARARYHFWRGVRLVTAGVYENAEAHFIRAIESAPDEHLPYGHYALGRIALGRGNYEAAREAFLQALRQDRNLTQVFVPLAKTLWNLGEYRAAWDRLERARIALPWDDSIPGLLAAWERDRPFLTADGEALSVARRAASVPPRVTATGERYEDAELLRVGLVENLESVYLKAGGPFRLTVNGTTVFESPGIGTGTNTSIGAAGVDTDALRVLHIAADAHMVSVTKATRSTTDGSTADAGGGIGEDGDVLYRGGGPVRLEYADRTYTTTIFDMTYGHGQFSSGREDRSYRGEIEILPRGNVFTIVNRLSVEEYLYSVVPSEIPAWWPPAALEAQAIAARSYTLHPRSRYDERGFDLLSSVASAYYPGVTNEHPRTTAAVDATQGLILIDGTRPLDAVYSANHAGYAEAAGSVWGWPNSLVATSDPLLPPLETRRSPGELYQWLVSLPDSYSAREPFADRSSYRWSLLVPRQTIEKRLADSGRSVGTILRIDPGPRGITGRIESVTIHGTIGEVEVRRDAIRSALGGLRSNLFVVSAYTSAYTDGAAHPKESAEERATAPSHFYFQGAGWGHGVGLDQTGAAGMAAAGFEAATILGHYYPNNEIVEWY